MDPRKKRLNKKYKIRSWTTSYKTILPKLTKTRLRNTASLEETCNLSSKEFLRTQLISLNYLVNSHKNIDATSDVYTMVATVYLKRVAT